MRANISIQAVKKCIGVFPTQDGQKSEQLLQSWRRKD